MGAVEDGGIAGCLLFRCFLAMMSVSTLPSEFRGMVTIPVPLLPEKEVVLLIKVKELLLINLEIRLSIVARRQLF